MSVLHWVTAVASLVAVWLNIRGRVSCFAIWGATNAYWALADWHHGIYAQAALQGVYFGMSLFGFLRWSEGGPVRARPEDST